MRKIDRSDVSKANSRTRSRSGSTLRIGLGVGLLIGILAVLAAFPPGPRSSAATQVDITGPGGSKEFGSKVVVLTNGNIVVTDPFWDASISLTNVGAVYLYNGATGALISTLTGTLAGDRVGLGGVVALTNGNFVVTSDEWNRPGVADAGAITLCNGVTGCNGPVTTANSLVGAATADFFSSVIYPLPNGKYVITSQNWNNGAISNAGMAILCDGSSGCTGEVLPANALVGNKANDLVGQAATVLANGNYVVHSDDWDNAGAVDAGAITFCNGTTGCAGMVVSAANSLVGATAQDSIGGTANITRLTNGSFVLRSPVWDNGGAANAGAVTWCSGTSGCTGVVSAATSRVGTTANDSVGNLNSVVALTNGNFIVAASDWDDGGTANVGAVTFCSGSTPCTGAVSAANSLIGSTAGDAVGNLSTAPPVALPNGNYVVGSGAWDNGAITNVGAVTLCSGTTGCTGPVTTANSLVGVTTVDAVGATPAVPLANGNFVVASRLWNNGAIADAGAVTFCDGVSGCAGQQVTIANSLTGSVASDQLGSGGVIALANGKYVVASPLWGANNFGAATLCDGAVGCTGVTPSAANSLVGSTTGDGVGNRLRALTNGNYVVLSPGWDRGGIVDAGAVTFCTGTAGCTGSVSIANSVVGSTAADSVGLAASGPGIDPLVALPNGNYLVNSTAWDNGSAVDAGAIRFCDGNSGCVGAISPANALVGSTTNDRIGYRESGIIFLNGLNVLPSGDYLVVSGDWDNGAIANAGAATFGSATGGVAGAISASNSVLGGVLNGGSVVSAAFDTVNNQMVVGRPKENTVSLFRLGGGGPTPTPTPASVSGVVSYATTPAGQGTRFVPGVALAAAGSVPANAVTNASGAYSLSGLGSGMYTVTPSKSGDVNGSISGLDAARVAQHVAGLINLTPNQQIAGDATNNGSLSGLDAARIAQFAAGLTNPGIAGTWKFLPASRTYQSVTGAVTGENYEAILVGEVTGNWVPAAARAVDGEEDREVAERAASHVGPGDADQGIHEIDSAAIDLAVPTYLTGTRGRQVIIPVSVGETTGRGILAFDLTLEFDPAVMRPAAVDTVSAAGTLSDGWTVVHNSGTPGRLRITAFGTLPLVGKGTMLNLRFEMVGEASGRDGALRWTSFELNEGQVPVHLAGGQFGSPGASGRLSSLGRGGLLRGNF